MDDKDFMRLAVKEAKKGDYPFGAIIVKDDKIIAKTHNTAKGIDPTQHAEINAIRKACKIINNKYLEGCTLYSTCEPCPMCFTAALWAHVSRIVYGAGIEDIKEDNWRIDVECNYLNNKSGNKIKIKGGVLRKDCLDLFK